MKRLIIITGILIVAAGYITFAYFKNLSPPGLRTDQVIRNIPANAALIFEFSNEDSFYDIFKENKLTALAGKQSLADLNVLRKALVKKTPLQPFFGGQNIFMSLHPSATNTTDILITAAAKKDFEISVFDELVKTKDSNMLVNPFTIAGKKGYTVYIKSLNKRFFIISKGNNIFSGSFSKQLIEECAKYKTTDHHQFALLPANQNANALANLYINYQQVEGLFKQLFKNETGIFSNLRQLPATAVLSLNYKSDALMFNGTTTIDKALPASYLSLFINQQPVQNQLKDIFPSTTAYSTGFAVSNASRFTTDLAGWQKKTGKEKAAKALLTTIDNETGVDIRSVFNEALGNEFAIVTTRFQEKLAIIAVKNGSKIAPAITNVSTPVSENRGRFNYDRLPYYLLGDAFSIFRKPYFIIIDNYLILANSNKEIDSYYESYINRKFLVKMDQYNNFDNLMSQRSNVCAFVNFKNLKAILKRDLATDVFTAFEDPASGWQDVYGASYQLTATDKSYYTNFCIGLNTDTDEGLTSTGKLP